MSLRALIIAYPKGPNKEGRPGVRPKGVTLLEVGAHGLADALPMAFVSVLSPEGKSNTIRGISSMRSGRRTSPGTPRNSFLLRSAGSTRRSKEPNVILKRKIHEVSIRISFPSPRPKGPWGGGIFLWAGFGSFCSQLINGSGPPSIPRFVPIGSLRPRPLPPGHSTPEYRPWRNRGIPPARSRTRSQPGLPRHRPCNV